HVGEVVLGPGTPPVRVLGMTSHFDSESFFGAVITATFRTADSANMKRFLGALLDLANPAAKEKTGELLNRTWQQQQASIEAALAAESGGEKNVAPGALHLLTATELSFDRQRLEPGGQ